MKKHVLFICTGNTCRSQLAEAIVNAERQNDWQAYSAGVSPATHANPNALRVLKEIGIETSGSPTQHVSEYKDTPFDLVITLCDYARAVAPPFSQAKQQLHISIPDPFGASGSSEEILQIYRDTRDEISEMVLPVLKHTSQ